MGKGLVLTIWVNNREVVRNFEVREVAEDFCVLPVGIEDDDVEVELLKLLEDDDDELLEIVETVEVLDVLELRVEDIEVVILVGLGRPFGPAMICRIFSGAVEL